MTEDTCLELGGCSQPKRGLFREHCEVLNSIVYNDTATFDL